jgi:hypothetical protein
MAAKAAVVIISFILAKICVMTVREVKINANTFASIFKNLLNPLIFSVICAVIFTILAFICALPFLFPAFADKSYIIVSAIAAGIAVLALIPNALMSLFFSYEGKSLAEAVSAGNAVLKGRHGKMFFLTISLFLLFLVLKFTYAATAVILPLVIMSMAQARESLIKIEEEKKKAEEAKLNKSGQQRYRPKVDYTKDYVSDKKLPVKKAEDEEAPAIRLGTVFQARPEEKKDENPAVREEKEEQPQNIKIGLENIFKVNAGEKEEEPKNNKNDKLMSASEYAAPVSTQEHEEQESLSDFIDLGISYENNEERKEDDKENESGADMQTAADAAVEIEIEPSQKNKETKREYKSGKAYIEDFGTIKRKNSETGKPDKQDQQKQKDAKKYIENFGIINKKK